MPFLRLLFQIQALKYSNRMNQSRNADPLRFLKKMKSRTPSKVSKQSSRTDSVMTESAAMVESKLEQTVLLKQNCYDPNKYYSEKCERYLIEIGFRRKQSPTFKDSIKNPNIQRIRSRQNLKSKASEDSLTEILMTKQRQTYTIVPPPGQELTFKKIDFGQKSESLGRKQLPKQVELQVELEKFEDENEGAGDSQLKECQTCHRRFNPESYVKHVRICEKVFVKKRKQFSSQKQRSQSKQAKNP